MDLNKVNTCMYTKLKVVLDNQLFNVNKWDWKLNSISSCLKMDNMDSDGLK